MEVLELIKKFGLTERDCNDPVTDIHLDIIARSCSASWTSLVTQLEVKDIVVNNNGNTQDDPEEERKKFYRKWKISKGADATYSQLINAMLKIDCKLDAEEVCKLLQESIQAHPARSASPNVTVSQDSPPTTLLAAVFRPANEPAQQLQATTPTGTLTVGPTARPYAASSDIFSDTEGIAVIVSTIAPCLLYILQ